MGQTAREIYEQREEGRRQAEAGIAELHEAARPRVPDLPEDPAERDALLAKIDDPEGFTFRGEAEEAARAKELLRAEDLPAQLRAEVDRTEERIYGAGPDAGDEMRHLARLHAWMEQEYEKTLPAGSTTWTKGVNRGDRGGLAITKNVGRPAEVVHHSPEEVAALQAERDQAVADLDRPFGTLDSKSGAYTITPADVTAAFATDPAKASTRWLELDEAERESLLRGQDVTGVRLKSKEAAK